MRSNAPVQKAVSRPEVRQTTGHAEFGARLHCASIYVQPL